MALKPHSRSPGKDDVMSENEVNEQRTSKCHFSSKFFLTIDCFLFTVDLYWRAAGRENMRTIYIRKGKKEGKKESHEDKWNKLSWGVPYWHYK